MQKICDLTLLPVATIVFSTEVRRRSRRTEWRNLPNEVISAGRKDYVHADFSTRPPLAGLVEMTYSTVVENNPPSVWISQTVPPFTQGGL